ncbi:nucleotidyl transferase AbiEii/AbiGii toxin family protein [Candidatus Pacearchaeota archaeon]|nr:nucleotidyl transferase AbiEii/AbiGii toxin family protein [Candidatus Pacearchaeota archaeon]
MEQLHLREKEIFETLKLLKKNNFVVIGGYAVNAYALPRFSVDCDMVVKDNKEVEKIEIELLKLGYIKIKRNFEIPYGGKFIRYEKRISGIFKVSMDIMVGNVVDRGTNAGFSAKWIFENSKLRNLKGKTISENLKLRIINPDALFVMKMISCRPTDIRDIFLLIGFIRDKKWMQNQISGRVDFADRLKIVKKKISSKQFKDDLQGVFGIIDPATFEKYKKMIFSLEKPDENIK